MMQVDSCPSFSKFTSNTGKLDAGSVDWFEIVVLELVENSEMRVFILEDLLGVCSYDCGFVSKKICCLLVVFDC